LGPIGRFGRMWRLTLPGCWGAVILACLSFTPSLLPRGGPLQGIVCGITAAIGYGLGVLAAWIWRAFADRPTRIPSTRAWRILLISAVSAPVGRVRPWAVLAVRDPSPDGRHR